ncbi:MAG: 4Fe-4S binding protein [Nitrospirae bacterium]|nr:4Fe-4S binding protein [Nitrospirota bacterium]
MSLFTIDEKKCKRDGICVAECPIQIIEMKDDKSIPAPTAYLRKDDQAKNMKS